LGYCHNKKIGYLPLEKRSRIEMKKILILLLLLIFAVGLKAQKKQLFDEG